MEAGYIDYSETQSFSPTVVRYLQHDPALQPFINHFPNLSGFNQHITTKKHLCNREILTEVLRQQYADIRYQNQESVAVHQNISRLAQSDTYTVTTGHQLNLFTGPLYFIYKIVSTISLAKDLQVHFPDKHFVPVYWMASEDHDFEEINHTYLYRTKITWQHHAEGATGRLAIQNIAETLKVYQRILGLSDHTERLIKLTEEAYLQHNNLADATHYLVHQLFAKYGLVIIDADNKALKQQFAEIMKRDILEQNSFRNVEECNAKLASIDVKTQVHTREINFFYLKDHLRERLVRENGVFRVLGTDIRFTEHELSEEINHHPERFSPNVVMRPLYQEVILPNLAYIGGGAELTYWLQLKSNFDFYGIDFPILLLRNSAVILNKSTQHKLNRLQLCVQDLFTETEMLKKNWIQKNSMNTLHFADEKQELEKVFEKIKNQSIKIDTTLSSSAEAIAKRLNHAINKLEKKLMSAEKRNHKEAMAHIETLKSGLFPMGMLQERIENFGMYYAHYGDSFIDNLTEHLHPLKTKFTILEL